MAYKIERIVEKDNEDPWWPKQQGRWEVRDAAGKVIYKFKWWFTGDRAEWDDREFWDGPMVVRISTDGKWVECVYQTGVQHGVAFEGTLGEKIERHPLPPA